MKSFIFYFYSFLSNKVLAIFLKKFIRSVFRSSELLGKKVLVLNLINYFDLLTILEQKKKVEVYSALFTIYENVDEAKKLFNKWWSIINRLYSNLD